MKRPGFYLAAIFITTICSTALVSVLVTGIARMVQKHDKADTAKSVSADQQKSELTQNTISY